MNLGNIEHACLESCCLYFGNGSVSQNSLFSESMILHISCYICMVELSIYIEQKFVTKYFSVIPIKFMQTIIDEDISYLGGVQNYPLGV